MPDAAGELEDQVADREELRMLQLDLADLPERQRAALVLRELNGLSHAEIGVVLELSPSAVKQAIFEARTALFSCREGREMACHDVRRMLSDGDGRVLRGRGVRAHLRSCPDCRRFRADLEQRPRALRALAPPLPVGSAAALLSQLLGGGATAAKLLACVAIAGGGTTLAVEMQAAREPAPRQVRRAPAPAPRPKRAASRSAPWSCRSSRAHREPRRGGKQASRRRASARSREAHKRRARTRRRPVETQDRAVRSAEAGRAAESHASPTKLAAKPVKPAKPLKPEKAPQGGQDAEGDQDPQGHQNAEGDQDAQARQRRPRPRTRRSPPSRPERPSATSRACAASAASCLLAPMASAVWVTAGAPLQSGDGWRVWYSWPGGDFTPADPARANPARARSST